MKRRLLSLLTGGTAGLAVWLLIGSVTTRTLAIVALLVNLGLLVGLAALAVVLLRFWSTVSPQLLPLLSMFAPPAAGAEPAGGADSGRVVAPPAATVNGHVIGEHFQSCGVFDGRPCDCALQP